MSLFHLQSKQASMVWLEPNRVHAGGTSHICSGWPDPDRIASILGALPAGPTSWILDDAWAPCLLVKDLAELPPSGEAREAFFRWRFEQQLALEAPQSVQALALGESAWLLAGMPQDRKEALSQIALRVGRPIYALAPRWLWIYNRLAPHQETPGMLLSLSAVERGYTGTLAAWGRTLTLLRQWSEPAPAEVWMHERVTPSAAFLQREGRPAQKLWVWGASTWPDGALPVQLLQPEIPAQETL